MKEKLKNKKVIYTIIGIISVMLIAITLSYAYWVLTKTQLNSNEVSATCLDISLTNEKNNITLQNQFPISDEEGEALTPYEFTVTNNCNTSVDYQVALEALNVTGKTPIISSAIRLKVNDKASKLFSAYSETEATLKGAYEARKIYVGRLAAASSETTEDTATFKVTLWIDKDAPISEASTAEVQKTFQSKITVSVGHGIQRNIEEGTLAYDILSNHGGEGSIGEVDVTEVKERLVSKTTQSIWYSNKTKYGTDYTYNEETKKYELAGTISTLTEEECFDSPNLCLYTLQTPGTSGGSVGKDLYKLSNFRALDEYENGYDVEHFSYTTTFASHPNDEESGLYSAKDDLGTSYYFRGNVENNYVKFGTYAAGSSISYNDYYIYPNGWHEYMGNETVTFDAETPMYWRILRINGDGTIRMIYDGTEKVHNGTKHIAVVSSASYTDDMTEEKYVGYTYDNGAGTQVDSTIKAAVDSWYNTTLKTNFGKYISDGIFCNDIGQNSYQPIYTKKPVLTCNDNYKYTTGKALGNGYLTNPVGLPTASEIMMAGEIEASSSYTSNKNAYIYSGDSFATMTLSGTEIFEDDPSSSGIYMYNYKGDSGLNSDYAMGARPVINLRADVKFTGDGSFETPYEIVME